MNKKFLLVIALLLLLPADSIGQDKFRYWFSAEVMKYEFEYPKMTFYTKWKKNSVLIKMVNKSCFDLEYNLEFYVKKSGYGDTKFFKTQYDGIIKAGDYKIFSREHRKEFKTLHASSIRTALLQDGNPTPFHIYTVAEDDWINNNKTLKCLGYNSKFELLDERKRKQEKFDREQARIKKEKERVKELKLKNWLNKGLDYHRLHYSKKGENGFFINVPPDSLEMFAKSRGQYLLVINTYPARYDLNELNFNEEQKAFVETNLIAGTILDTGKKKKYRKTFFDWADEKGLKVGSPAIVLLDPNGKVIYSKYTNTKDIKIILPRLMAYIFQNLPTID